MAPADDLDILAFEFFREFARCEYCLKAVGIRQNTHDAKADWGAFAAEIEGAFDAPASDELRTAIDYLIKHPPKKQTVANGLLEWNERLPNHKTSTELILRLICRIRNNLFHGGKFNGHWFEPQRSQELLVTHISDFQVLEQHFGRIEALPLTLLQLGHRLARGGVRHLDLAVQACVRTSA